MKKSWSEIQERTYSTRGADEATRGLESDKVKFLLDYVGSNKKVLDLGCNDGAVCNVLHERGNDVVGVDLEKLVRIARKKHPHLKFVAADLSHRFPFKNNTFDVIYASEILEHIPDDQLFLKECYRILVAGGGGLLITTPNHFYFGISILTFWGHDWRDPIRDSDTHIHFYSFKTLGRLLMYVGFKIAREKGLEHKLDKTWYPLERILPKTFKNSIMMIALKIEPKGKR